MSIEIDIVEDQRLIRDLLADALADALSLTVRAVFANAEDAWDRWRLDPPAAALVDIVLPDMNGVQLGVRAKRAHPSVGIVLLSSTAYPALLDRLPVDVRSGWAYLMKDDVDLDAITEAVETTLSGGVVVGPGVDATEHDAVDPRHLSPRQAEMLKHIAAGLSNSAIATQMHLTRKSVENAINRLYVSLGLPPDDVETNRRVVASLIASRLLDVHE